MRASRKLAHLWGAETPSEAQAARCSIAGGDRADGAKPQRWCRPPRIGVARTGVLWGGRGGGGVGRRWAIASASPDGAMVVGQVVVENAHGMLRRRAVTNGHKILRRGLLSGRSGDR